MKRVCCIFNYAPDYRESIYKKIDETFDTQFVFAEEVEHGKDGGIPKIDYSIFSKKPYRTSNRHLISNYIWRTNILKLPFKKFSDFIITGDANLSYFPFFIFCRLLGKRTYGWGHGFKTLNGISGMLGRLYMKLINGYFVYSEKGKSRMESFGIPGKKLHVIYNSLSGRISEIKTYPKDIYTQLFKNNNPVLIFIGRLTASKRIDVLLDILKKHKDEGLLYNLMIIGDGPEKIKLEQQCQELNIQDSVYFYGACHDNAILAPFLYNADLCVSPGNVGLTAISALAYGTPVISHDSFDHQGPEFETIIPNQTGLLYRYNDFDDLSKKIRQWLENPHDRDTIRKACLEVINSKWNSDYQIGIIKQTIEA